MVLDDLKFGVATSAYQIEGAWNEDGKVPSIWDEISHGNMKWKVEENHTGDIACDHYHKYPFDVRLMKDLGVHMYRFSISWSRICTQECMCSNIKGIKYYQSLVWNLLEAKIEPFITLYHWDLPKWLDDIGGWGNKKSIEYFKCYAETMFKALPDVKYWITFNEPAVFISNHWGHNNLSKAIKNVLIAHGEVAKLAKKYNKKIGISLNLMPVIPNNDLSKYDRKAADNFDKLHNKIWLDPIFKGEFPDEINEIEDFGGKLKFNKKEKKIVSTPIDFLGINYYSMVKVEYSSNNKNHFRQVPFSELGVKKDDMGVSIIPEGLYSICSKMKREYGNPELYITENGCATSDVIYHDARVHDSERINYIKNHLRMCKLAIDNKVNLKGYFHWSLMDNFEWLYGYGKKFGLVSVFLPTQSRICKDSYIWYRTFIKNNSFREKVLG